MRHLVALLVISSWAASGCSTEPRTEVLLVVSTDYAVPAEVSEFSVMASGPNMQIQTAGAVLTDPEDLPRTLGLVHQGGELGPIDVTIAALVADSTLDDRRVVERRVVFEFQRGRTLQLRIDLDRACADVTCDSDLTCEAGVCRAIDIEPSELTPWPDPPAMDSGVPEDAGDAGDAADAALDGMVEDSGVLDGGGEDAGPMTCDGRYGSLTDYALCVESPVGCEFYSVPDTVASCDSICALGGGTCAEAFTKHAGSNVCRRDVPISCDLPDDDPICVCAW